MENTNATFIEIRDVIGRLMKQATIEYKGNIDIGNLQNGVYFVNLVSDKQITSSKKIVIIK